MTLQELIQKIELAYGVREATTLLVSEIADRIDEINDRPDELRVFANSLRENINELAAAAAADGAIARAAADQRVRMAADARRREERQQVAGTRESASDMDAYADAESNALNAAGDRGLEPPIAFDPLISAPANADWSGQGGESGGAGASASFDSSSSDSGGGGD